MTRRPLPGTPRSALALLKCRRGHGRSTRGAPFVTAAEGRVSARPPAQGPRALHACARPLEGTRVQSPVRLPGPVTPSVQWLTTGHASRGGSVGVASGVFRGHLDGAETRPRVSRTAHGTGLFFVGDARTKWHGVPGAGRNGRRRTYAIRFNSITDKIESRPVKLEPAVAG